MADVIYGATGINFAAHGNIGGMTSELLDDYEEGTWTAVSTSGGSVADPYVMTYTKVGGLATLQGQVRQGTGQSSGGWGLESLPFTNVASPTTGNSLACGALRIYLQDVVDPGNGAGAVCVVEGSASTMQFYLNRDNEGTVELQRDDSAYFAFSISFRVN